MIDILLIENNNGGDVVFNGSDLEITRSLKNMVYIALFGGNIEQSTTDRVDTEEAFDWWGNRLLFNEFKKQQYNSKTEKALDETPLTSSGRLIIEDAARTDLKFMQDFADVSVSVAITATDKVAINVSLKQPNNEQAQEIIFIWDNLKKELND